MDVKRIRILTETFIATDETEKYTDVRVILAQLSGGTVAGRENRRDKVYTLQLEGYRKFDFMLLRLENAATMYTRHGTIMRESCEISHRFLTYKRHFQWKTFIFSQCTFCYSTKL